MPGVRVDDTHKRPHRAVASDDEEESDSDTSSKRVRVNGNASTQGDEYDDEFNEDAHQPGSIVRVKLINFVTYTAAEFHPGPSLNMVIGPNGTGKSTLVCAICLGLGWSTIHLGRAKEIGEFVKHGCEKAEIEIELAASRNQRKNPVIRRTIRKEDNKSVFFIDGAQSTQKAVSELARSFSIQIDNLCQFLPQDRVVEFAKLDPISLLRETQRAAAPDQMIIWHDKLKQLRNTEKELQLQQATEERHLAELKRRQNDTREDVERWNERQTLVLKSKALEKCRPIVETRVLQNEVKALKAELHTAKQNLRQLEAEEAPARLAQQEMATYRDQIDQIVKNRKSNVGRANKMVDNLAESIKKTQGAVADLIIQKDSEREAEKKRKQQVNQIDKEIAKLNEDVANEPVQPDDAGSTRRDELRSESSRIERRLLDVDHDIAGARQLVGEQKQKLAQKKGERERLNTQSGQQASLLEKVARDAAKGWRWIEENRTNLPLQGQIYGPPILECSVTDPRMADAVESQLRLMDNTAITCENGDDAKLISDKLLGDLRLHQVSIRTSPQPLSFYQSPVTREELTGYGLEGWLLDYLKGPEAVLAMLCDSAQIHRTAFTPRPISEQQHQALENSPISAWIAGQEKYQITRRREYGASSTRVIAVKKAQFFVDQPVNAEEQRRLDNEIKEAEQDMHERIQRFRSFTNEKQELNQKLDGIKAEMKEIQDERDRVQKAYNMWRALPRKIAEKKTQKEEIQRLMATTTSRVRDLIEKIEQGSLDIAKKTLEYTKAVHSFQKFHEKVIEAEIRLIEAESEVESLEQENKDITQRVEAMRASVKEREVRKKEIVNKHNNLVHKANDAMRNATEEEKEIAAEFQHLPSIAELENEIEAVSARLAMMADGNPNAIREHEKREHKINTTEAKLNEIRAGIATATENIAKIRGRWEPELDALVAKISDGFSHNFQGIGCAGQVGVYKDEDFENWSIQIQVRFRENESLSILDSHRQSGGERAVSTIFYLMALQGLARSPFRVVDEINQGMDPRNERMVHERMVDIACRERTSQYFLITPKLLSNLKFHPKMKVHCIASGEHMPDKHEKLDLPELADLALRIRRGEITVS